MKRPRRIKGARPREASRRHISKIRAEKALSARDIRDHATELASTAGPEEITHLQAENANLKRTILSLQKEINKMRARKNFKEEDER